MTSRDRRYLILTCCLGSAVVNAIINGGLGWGMTHSLPLLPLWRIPGVVADLAGTAFGVTFGTCLGMVLPDPARRGGGPASGRSTRPRCRPASPRSSRAFSPARSSGRWASARSRSPSSLLPGRGGAGRAGASGRLDRVPFVVLKSGFAALQAAMVTPFIALAALGDVARK